MIHKEYHWKGHDGIMLYGQSWMPETPAKAVINYVHGFKDHSNRFERWALRFVSEGIGVIAIDLRGHGHSEGKRGYAKNFNDYIRDVRLLRRKAEELYGNSFQILYGHSLGGNIVSNYLIARKIMPQAAVVTSPWFTLALKPSWIALVGAHIIRLILPNLMISSTLDAQYLSHDQKVVDDYGKDPLVHNLIRPKLFFEIEKNGILASTSIYKINVPMLVMHGSDDHITSFRQTKNFVRNAGPNTLFKEWPQGFHELHNEPEEKEIFSYVLGWINNQIQLNG
jgi:alpha-beta hydrolase superfamily lysophospholipase